MKNLIRKILRSLFYNNSILLSEHKIILESNPDFNDSSLKIFEELLRRKINEKYKIYWFVLDKKQFRKEAAKYKNVYFVNHYSIKGKLVQLTSKYIIDSNRFVRKRRQAQLRIFLDHGCALKMPYDYSKKCGEFDYGVLTSEYFIEPHIKLYGGKKNDYLILGSPRCDGLLNDVHVKDKKDKKKYIIWMPTFRNHKNPVGAQTGISFPFGVPCIENESQLAELNDLLAKKNTVLILKMHPAEDTSRLTGVKLSNIILYEDSFLSKATQMYEALKDTDALITDYSSIYYDYLLLKQPIGLAIPDLKEYTDSYELVEKNYKDFMKGSYIFTFKDLLKYVSDVADGKKMFSKEMKWALDRYNAFIDSDSSKRVVDFLVKEMEKKK